MSTSESNTGRNPQPAMNHHPIKENLEHLYLCSFNFILLRPEDNNRADGLLWEAQWPNG